MVLQTLATGTFMRTACGLRVMSATLTNDTPSAGYVTLTLSVASNIERTGSISIRGRGWANSSYTTIAQESITITDDANESVVFSAGTATYTFVWDAAGDLGVGTAWEYVYVTVTPYSEASFAGEAGSALSGSSLITHWNYFGGLDSDGKITVNEPDNVEIGMIFSFEAPTLARTGNVRYKIEIGNDGYTTVAVTLDTDDQDAGVNESWTNGDVTVANEAMTAGPVSTTITADNNQLDSLGGIDWYTIEAEIKED